MDSFSLVDVEDELVEVVKGAMGNTAGFGGSSSFLATRRRLTSGSSRSLSLLVLIAEVDDEELGDTEEEEEEERSLSFDSTIGSFLIAFREGDGSFSLCEGERDEEVRDDEDSASGERRLFDELVDLSFSSFT